METPRTVRLFGNAPAVVAPEIHGDDSLGAVTRKLAFRAGRTDVYWCVLSASPPADNARAVLDAFGGDVARAAAALLGPDVKRPPKTEAALLAKAAEASYVCPYAVAGHADALPPSFVARAVVFEELPGAIFVSPSPSPKFVAASTPDDGADAIMAALAAVADPLPLRQTGPQKIRVRHALCASGTVVPAGTLRAIMNAVVMRTDGVYAMAHHSVSGDMAFNAWAPAVRAGMLDATEADALCRDMMRKGDEALLVVVAHPDCDGPARVLISRDMMATVYLRTDAEDPAATIRAVVGSPDLDKAVRAVLRTPLRAVPDDVLDLHAAEDGVVLIVSRHTSGRAVAMNAFTAALDRAAGVLWWTRTDTGADVMYARTPGFARPSDAQVFLMKRSPMIAQGRTAELLREMGAALDMPPDMAQAELNAFMVSRGGRYRGGALPDGYLVASVSAGVDSLNIATETNLPARYARRLLWCLQRCHGLSARKRAITAGTGTQDVLRAAREARAAAAAAAGDDGVASKTGSKFVLKRLYDADPELFRAPVRPGGKMYSKICGAVDARQPIVVPPAALAALRAGTSAELHAVETRGNAYICPEVFCPTTMTVMTAEEYAAAGSRCSDGHAGVVLQSAYWRGNPARYPSLMGPEKHPAGLCMPCCFKRGADSAKQRRGDAVYVLSESYVPLPVGRRGSARGVPGAHRVGVQGATFVACLAAAQGADVETVVAELRRAATTSALLRVGRGGLLQRFIDVRNAPQLAPQFAQFLKTQAGRDHRDAVGASADVRTAAGMRSLVLYAAAVSYREYLGSATAGHAFVLPLLPLAFPGRRTCVLEALDDGTVVAHAPLGGGVAARPGVETDLVLKDNDAYEPLEAAGDARAWRELTVAAMSAQTARVSPYRPLARLLEALEARGRDVAAHVLDPDLRCVGVVLSPDMLFVPLERPDGDTSTSSASYLWYGEHAPARGRIAPEDARASLRQIADDLGWDFLSRTQPAGSPPVALIAATAEGDRVVPLRSDAPEIAELFRSARDAVVEFARLKATAGPVPSAVASNEALARLLDAMESFLRREHLREKFVLSHPLCPYPREVRARRLMELTSPVHSDATRDVVARAVNMLMTRQHAAPDAGSRLNVLTATQDDVVDGTLAAAMAALGAPQDHVDIVRRALVPAVRLWPKIVHVGQAWAAPVGGLTLRSSEDSDVFADIAAIAAAAGVGAQGTRAGYIATVVDDIARAASLGRSLTDLGLDGDVLEAAQDALDAARASKGALEKRLISRLTDAGAFRVGPGDLARALSGPKSVAVVLHPLGNVVEGSGGRTVVALLQRGRVLAAFPDAETRDPVFEERSALPRGVRALVGARQ